MLIFWNWKENRKGWSSINRTVTLSFIVIVSTPSLLLFPISIYIVCSRARYYLAQTRRCPTRYELEKDQTEKWWHVSVRCHLFYVVFDEKSLVTGSIDRWKVNERYSRFRYFFSFRFSIFVTRVFFHIYVCNSEKTLIKESAGKKFPVRANMTCAINPISVPNQQIFLWALRKHVSTDDGTLGASASVN